MRLVAASAVTTLPCGTSYATQNEGSLLHGVEISDFTFSIEMLAVRVGDRIVWVNNDIVPHTATAKDRSWDTGLIAPDASAILTVTAGMTTAYFCEYHPVMVAQIVLEAAQ